MSRYECKPRCLERMQFGMYFLKGGGSSSILFWIMIFDILVGRNIEETFAEIFGPLRHSPFGAEVQKFRKNIPP